MLMECTRRLIAGRGTERRVTFAEKRYFARRFVQRNQLAGQHALILAAGCVRPGRVPNSLFVDSALAWAIVGLVLVIAELLSGTFYLLMLAVAAFGAALAAYFGQSFPVQSIVAAGMQAFMQMQGGRGGGPGGL